VHTDDLVARGEGFLIVEDKGEREGTYGKYHTFIIKFEGEDPLVWNTGAWRIIELEKHYEFPILIKSLAWKRDGVKKTLVVVPGSVQKARA